jgi:ethanolamine permease
VGIIALLTGRTGDLITIACFGALTLYILSMVAYMKLRRSEPFMLRPFKAPFYPAAPVISALIALCCFVAMAWFSPWHAGLFLLFLASFSIITILFRKKNTS